MNELQIKKNAIRESRLADSELDTSNPLAEGEVLLKIDRFGFTANNVTYAAAGFQLGYWQFFPASANEANEWGIIPVWGFADVVESAAKDLVKGERIFGYFPTASYLKMQNVKVLDSRIIDGAEHRAELPPGYNTYRRVDKEANYESSMDNLRMLLWPLYITSFCLWDSLQHNKWHGAKQVLVVSASSKTSIGLAYALADDSDSPSSVGLTSPSNKAFVEQLALYDNVIDYDSLDEIDNSIPSVIVDMSGNSKLLAALQDHLGDSLLHCLNVGLTHWSDGGGDTGIDKQKREFFFAPSHIQMRIKEWGSDQFDTKSSEFVYRSSKRSAKWMQIESLTGVEKLAEVYQDVCDGRLPPAQALVVTIDE